MPKHARALSLRGLSKANVSTPHAIGLLSLLAAGLCACWLRSGEWVPAVSPSRAMALLVVGAYLVSATLLLLDDR